MVYLVGEFSICSYSYGVLSGTSLFVLYAVPMVVAINKCDKQKKNIVSDDIGKKVTCPQKHIVVCSGTSEE